MRIAFATVLVAVGLAVGSAVHHATPPAQHRSAVPPAVVTPPPAAVVAPVQPVHHAPTVPHDRVAAAAPSAFQIKGSAFDIKASVCAMENIRPLDPPGDQLHTVCWVRSGFGVAPGSKSGGTSYILGHAWAQAQLVFNPLSELASKEIDQQHPVVRDGVATFPVKHLNGYRVTLHTRNGRLTYVVRRAFAVGKAQAAGVHSLMANSPNRVVLITCAVAGGVDLDYNIVVYAYLVSSVAAA
ncbi:MAG: hypothetical protein DLM58_03695 [Pseudonocardiales bacterium]|nr:MAG: hypothetical protein DLM58_03695 [Pseudonocardiales bacterium]